MKISTICPSKIINMGDDKIKDGKRFTK